MVWTAPRTWAVGELVTDTLLNTHLRDNLRFLKGIDGQITFDDNIFLNVDDKIIRVGVDGDLVLAHRSTSLGANTALTNVLIGVPVTPAIAANSLIFSNATASGDFLLAANLAGNSQAYLWVNSSASRMTLYAAGVARIQIDTTVTIPAGGLTVNRNAAEVLLLQGVVVAGGAGNDGNEIIDIQDRANSNRHIKIGIDSTNESGWIQYTLEATGHRPLLLNPAGGNLIIGGSVIGAATIFYTAGAGVQLGQPVGGDKGAGTMNAVAVYDDNVLLTDWVFDLYYNFILPEGLPQPKDARLWGLQSVLEFTRSEHRLPWMPTWEEFENERSLGKMVTRLWEGQEQQQLHIFNLLEEIDILKIRLSAAGIA